MKLRPIIIKFETKVGLDITIQKVILKTLDEMVIAARDNIAVMVELNDAAKQLRYATDVAIGEHKYGHMPKRYGD